MATKQAFNYEFRLLLEGIAVPFNSASVVCTPNGVEFNVNVPACKEIFDLKPKTSAQIFYREWYSIVGKKPAWRMLADGFLSSYVVGEDAQGGRGVGLICRDFRMDIRKTPAALAWSDQKELEGEVQAEFSISGIYNKIVTQSTATNKAPVDVRIHDNAKLMDLGAMIARITGTAYGNQTANAANGGHLFDNFVVSTSEITNEQMKSERQGELTKGQKPHANGGLFLDAFIRGIWLEAVGGTRANSFLNKRIRADKRFLVPRNYAGYNFWHRQAFGLEIGSAMMGNSRFSSLEAAIMNVAGLFSTRVYSCSTPSLISLKDDNKGLDYVIDAAVKKFMVEQYKDLFGQPYILNETMLLPPLEFTAPPNCNLFFPPMYDRVNWQHDSDSDITRCYFGVIHSLSTTGGLDFGHVKFQIPNDLFGTNLYDPTVGGKLPPLTLEERYQGVSVYHGTVEYNLAAADAAKTLSLAIVNEDGKAVVKGARARAEKNVRASGTIVKPVPTGDAAQDKEATEKYEKAFKEAAQKGSDKEIDKIFEGSVAVAYKRHAMIKYINLKYSGRVATVDMAFNPFVMCGFPGAIISARDELSTNISKTILGTVQQVSHTIYTTTQSAEAATTVVMNNARFEDEPTDIDEKGLPLYMKATNKKAATFDINSYEFEADKKDPVTGLQKGPYRVPDAKPAMQISEDNKLFDLDDIKTADEGYIYAKDFLSTSNEDLASGKDENIYVDKSYEPNRISKFYTYVFGHAANHFMIDSYLDGKDLKYFVYDTMHEALSNIRKNKLLMTDYEECIHFVRRNICSANSFFHAILGLTSRRIDANGNPGYINDPAGDFDDEEPIRYWGMPSDTDTQILEPLGMSVGQFSSIREVAPLTALIRERRTAVNSYLNAVIQQASGVLSGPGSTTNT